jgi:hypothetical protein
MRDDEKTAREAGQWYDWITRGNGNPQARERAIQTALAMCRGDRRPDPKPRPLTQASLDAQPAKRAARLYAQQIATAKARAAAPLSPTRPARARPIDPDARDLFS